MKVKTIQAWAVITKTDIAGVVPIPITKDDEKVTHDMLFRSKSTGVFAVFEMKKYATWYAKRFYPKSEATVVRCTISLPKKLT